MITEESSKSRNALVLLLVATMCWGLSFPVMKALGLAQQELIPGASSWFVTSNTMTVRFGLSALLTGLFCLPSLARLSRLEIWQGLGLGFFGGVGIIFQMDGLAYTEASTSAFLTQCYCLLLPGLVAIRDRRRPAAVSLVACLIVLIGVAILARIDWADIKLGRGEWETLLGSVLFAGQVLWLERPIFSRNRPGPVSAVMFACIALISLPLAIWTGRQASDWLVVYRSPSVLVLLLTLVFFCTLVAFVLMNTWQKHLPAVQAGLIYCAEPLFASLFALFLPFWISQWTKLQYANETLTFHLLAGGALITLANVIQQCFPPPPQPAPTSELLARDITGSEAS